MRFDVRTEVSVRLQSYNECNKRSDSISVVGCVANTVEQLVRYFATNFSISSFTSGSQPLSRYVVINFLQKPGKGGSPSKGKGYYSKSSKGKGGYYSKGKGYSKSSKGI